VTLSSKTYTINLRIDLQAIYTHLLQRRTFTTKCFSWNERFFKRRRSPYFMNNQLLRLMKN